MPEPGGELFINAASSIVGSHDIILQSLDSWRGYKHADGSTEDLFFGSDRFIGTEQKWQTVPIIFGKRHPTTPYSVNPEAALKEAGGKIVGNLSDVLIPDSGTKTLRAKTNFTDPTVESLHNSGGLALSSGFLSGVSDGKLTGYTGGIVEPDHVLVFIPDKEHRPQDGAALFLNATMPDEPAGEDKALITKLKEVLRALTGGTNDPTVSQNDSVEVYGVNDPSQKATMYYRKNFTLMQNMEEKLTNSELKITELEKTVSDQAELIKNMTAELDGFRKADDARKAADLDAKWSLVKNSTSPGLYATPELEKVHRDEWTNDPTAYLLKNAITAKHEETSPDGVKFVKNGTSQATEDAEYLKFIHGDV